MYSNVMIYIVHLVPAISLNISRPSCDKWQEASAWIQTADFDLSALMEANVE